MSRQRHPPTLALLAVALLLGPGCAARQRAPAGAARPTRSGEPPGYLLVDGERRPVDLPVVTFLDAAGFDARRPACWFAPDRALPVQPAPGCDTPQRWSRRGGEPRATAERVTQVVVHYDAAGASSRCFEILHDVRGLSAHLLLDVDGTLYQTLDLATRARHAGTANDRSVGIEIAHHGAYADPQEARARLDPLTALRAPPGGPFAAARPGTFRDTLNGRVVHQRDFTEAQYRSLQRLLPGLRALLPRLELRAPRDTAGAVCRDALAPERLEAFAGLVGHLHVSAQKVDPGPAFDWERVLRAAAQAADPPAAWTRRSISPSSGNSPVSSFE